jgi:hypothetical protein
MAVATGLPFLGRFGVPKAGKVAYVLGEGAAGMPDRLRAQRQHRGIVDTDLHWMVGAVNLGAPDQVGALADAGLSLADVDGYFCDSTAPGFGPISMSDFSTRKPRSMSARLL